MPRGTTLRNFRAADPLWSAARAVADERGENLSDVLRAALEWYVEEPRRIMPPPPQREPA